MGRKSKYCVFHSCEGSGTQLRSGEVCGDIAFLSQTKIPNRLVLCKAFHHYGAATSQQIKEVKHIQKMAKAIGLQKRYTIRKIYRIHRQHNWNWEEAQNSILNIQTVPSAQSLPVDYQQNPEGNSATISKTEKQTKDTSTQTEDSNINELQYFLFDNYYNDSNAMM